MLYLIYIFLSLLFSAFFSAVETAFVALTSMQAKILKSRYPFRGKMIEFLQNHKPIFISAMVAGNNAANVVFSVFATRYTLLVFGEQAVFVATILIILSMLIFGEIPPKQIALQYHMQFLIAFAPLLCVFFILLWPVAQFFSFFSMMVQIFSKNKNVHAMESISQEHLLHFLYQMRFIKNIPQEKTRRITRTLMLSDVSVENIMTHRKDVFSLSSDTSIGEASQKLAHTFYTRIPVYEHDDVEHIIGFVYASDIFNRLLENNITMQIKAIMRKAVVLQESNSVEDALAIFERQETQFAIVIDEYGGLAGLLVYTDISAYVLNMHHSNSSHYTSSFDGGEFLKKDKHIIEDEKHENVFFVHGEAPLSEVEEIARVTLENRGESHTIGGYLSEYTGGGYIADEDNAQNFTCIQAQKTIEHELLGSFTILEEKNGRIVFLRWTMLPHNFTAVF